MCDIKINIVQDGKFWYGDACIDKTDAKREYKRVTTACATEAGARQEAERWKAMYEGAFF